MRTLGVIWMAASLAATAFADRFVMKDNSVRVGRLTGMDGGNFLVNVQGRVDRIPAASVSLVVFDEAAAAPATPAQPVRSSAPAANTSIFDGLDPVAPIVSQFTQEADGFRFDLERCTKQGTKSVTCAFKVTNLDADRRLGVVADNRTYYVDSEGMQRSGTGTRLGSSTGSYAETMSVTDVTVSATIEFPAVNPGVNLLAKLAILFHIPGVKDTQVEFRRIPLQGN